MQDLTQVGLGVAACPPEPLTARFKVVFGTLAGSGRVTAIGEVGVRIRADRAPPKDATLALEFDGGPSVLARVAWCERSANSTFDLGARFVFSDPQQQREVEAYVFSVAPRARPCGERPRTVLVVDDDEMTRWILQRKLEVLDGIAVLEADSVAAALNIARNQRLDLAFLDVYLPDGDGNTLLDELVALHPDMAAIVMSAMPSVETAIDAFDRDAFQFLRKPFEDASIIATTARQALAASDLERERRRLVEALASAVEQLEARNRQLVVAQEAIVRQEKLATVGRLSATVAHEIATPLSCLISNLELMRGEFLPLLVRAGLPTAVTHELAELAEDCASATAHIADISRGLLGCVHPSSVSDTDIDLTKPVSDALRLLRPQLLGRCRLVAEINAAPSRPGNATGISQLVINLVRNAADAFTDDDELHQSIIVRLEASATEARIVVADNGPGLAPEIRERLFDPFVTTKPAGQGTGLGLSICESIAHEHGGRIDVWSEPGVGTEFTVRLPLTPVADEDEGQRRRWVALALRDVGLDPEALRRLLHPHCLVYAAANMPAAEAALEALPDLDCILLGVGRPDADGRAFLERLELVRPDLVARTLLVAADGERRAAQQWADDAGRPLMLWPAGRVATLAKIAEVATRPGTRKQPRIDERS